MDKDRKFRNYQEVIITKKIIKQRVCLLQSDYAHKVFSLHFSAAVKPFEHPNPGGIARYLRTGAFDRGKLLLDLSQKKK